jgi:hypothetical protein
MSVRYRIRAFGRQVGPVLGAEGVDQLLSALELNAHQGLAAPGELEIERLRADGDAWRVDAVERWTPSQFAEPNEEDQ